MHELINHKFLVAFLNSNYGKIQANVGAIGIGLKNLNVENVRKYRIPLPPLPEQRAIVAKIEELFSDLDKGIADLKKAQDQLKVYRQAVLKKAFEGEYPQKKIIEIADVNTGATPKRGNSEFWENGTIPWVTSTVVNNDFVNEPSELITENAIKQTNCKLIPKGSLLVAMYGEGKTRGKCSELNIDTATNQALAGITLFKEYKESKQFVKWFFVKNYEEIRLLSSGGVQPNLNLTIIKNTIIPFPEHKQQIQIIQEIESRLSVCDKVEQSITESLEKARALRQSILKKAFEGNLLSEAEIITCNGEKDYEPASVLLKKIKAEKKKP
jgi:type I restriction enzyme S subunit